MLIFGEYAIHFAEIQKTNQLLVFGKTHSESHRHIGHRS